MELKIFSKDNKEIGVKKMPLQFSEPSRFDIIKRAVEVIFGNNRQRYGANPRAGKRHSVYLSKKRRRFRGVYGHSRTRTPKKVMSRSGAMFNWTGAFAPNARGGHRAFPPKANKIWACKINKKERKKAIRSALASSLNKDLVVKRGHKIPDAYPFIISNDFESISKTKDLFKILNVLGFKKEFERSSKKKIRPGKGKSRARPYKKSKGPLIVVSDNCKLLNTAKNIAGMDVIDIKNINVELLAPGCVPGRLTLFTEKAVDRIEKEGLFV
ncbi:50S ribosomal protein L4 [Candidatus Woesearchaeota archaeon]|nr:50S ribosomal protein L4 [Candidatus Woesearchaeota archaeon]MBW2978551.1 50S ribosomal protein L4 [Candidatus Woesearchaeota archaeon]